MQRDQLINHLILGGWKPVRGRHVSAFRGVQRGDYVAGANVYRDEHVQMFKDKNKTVREPAEWDELPTAVLAALVFLIEGAEK